MVGRSCCSELHKAKNKKSSAERKRMHFSQAKLGNGRNQRLSSPLYTTRRAPVHDTPITTV